MLVAMMKTRDDNELQNPLKLFLGLKSTYFPKVGQNPWYKSAETFQKKTQPSQI